MTLNEPALRSAASSSIVRGFGIRAGQLLLLLTVIGLWAALPRIGANPIIVSSPGAVVDFLKESFASGEMLTNWWATMKATLVAFAIGGVSGIALGAVLGLSPTLEAIAGPFLNALNSMPRIAFAPVFIVIFGINLSAKVALAVTLVVFILLESTRAGLQGADDDLLRMSKALNATRRQLLTKVLIPVAVPSIFAGLRLGLIYSLLGVVTSEIIAAKDGLGQLVALYSGTFNMAGVYGSLLIMGLSATVLNSAMGVVERRLLVWKEG